MKKYTKVMLMAAAVCLMVAMASCGGKKAPEVNPIWGMWMQEYPATSTKSEIMFNDDSTGFVFNVDTLVYETRWVEDGELKIEYKSGNGDALNGKTVSYKASVVEDTLELVDKASGTETRYIRIKD